MIPLKDALILKTRGFPQEPFWQVDVNAWGGSWYYLVVPDGCALPVFAGPDEYKNGIGRGDNLVKIPETRELFAWFAQYAEGGSVVSLTVTYEWTVNTPEFPAYKAVLVQAKGCGDDSTSWELCGAGQSEAEALAALFKVLKI